MEGDKNTNSKRREYKEKNEKNERGVELRLFFNVRKINV